MSLSIHIIFPGHDEEIEANVAFAQATENQKSELEVGPCSSVVVRRLLDPLTLRTKVTRELLYESPEGNVWQLVCASFFHGNGGLRKEGEGGRKEAY